MKKLLTIAAIAAASTALAVESSNTFGILRVDSSDTETVVAIPWLAAGGSEIAVKDVVKTAGLHENDQLFYYNREGNYRLWILNAQGQWVGSTTVIKGSDGTDIQVPAGNAETLARGGAIILVRSTPAAQFYLYGQYTDVHAEVTPVANGKTLIAPPIASNTGFDLNGDGAMTGTPAAGDFIVVDLGTVLTYNGDNGWSVATTSFENGRFTTSYDKTHATIPSGKGVWYVSTGDSVPTFHF